VKVVVASPDGAVGLDLAPTVARACERLLALADGYVPAAALARAEVLRSERRTQSTIHVIALRVPGAERRFYLKTLNPSDESRQDQVRRVQTEYGLLEMLSARLAGCADLGVVTPVACLPDDVSFLTEEFAGRKLDHILAGSSRAGNGRRLGPAAALCRTAGEWLRRFQELTAPADPSLYDTSELLAYCEERVRLILAGEQGEIEPGWARLVMRHVERLSGEVDDADLELVGRQNDFRPDNMLARDGRLVVLDFTGFTCGPRLYDLVKFWMRLEYLGFGPLSSGGSVAQLQASFREGYGGPVDLGSPLAELLRLANVLDKMSELAETTPPRGWRRVLERAWYRHLRREVQRAAIRS
jgi:hypothetical protein